MTVLPVARNDKGTSDVVGERLRELRKQRRLTVEALAARCKEVGSPELTTAAIYAIENGRKKDGARTRHVTVDELLAFASILDLSPLDLLAGDDSDASDANYAGEASEAVARLAAAVEELSGDEVTVEQVRRARKLYRLLGVELDEVEDNYR